MAGFAPISNNSNAEFISIRNGRFLIPVRNADGSYKVRVDENGQTVKTQNGNDAREYTESKEFTGSIIGIDIIEDKSALKRGDMLFLRLKDDENQEFVITEPIVVGQKHFVSALAENIIMGLGLVEDIQQKIFTIKVWSDQRKDKTGKPVTTADGKLIYDNKISIHADGDKTEWAVAPKDRPEMVYSETFKAYDNTARVKFLKDWVSTIKSHISTAVSVQEQEVEAEAPVMTDQPADDLPM